MLVINKIASRFLIYTYYSWVPNFEEFNLISSVIFDRCWRLMTCVKKKKILRAFKKKITVEERALVTMMSVERGLWTH